MEDDWDNDMRFAAVVLMKHILIMIQAKFEYEQYREVYPELLKRLDDAQDGIRIENCKVLEIFFDGLPDPWSSSLYEYTIKNIFVHLDDQNDKIQQAVQQVLKKAARVQTHDFIRISQEIEGKS